MDDFDFTYFQRHIPFHEGALNGKITAQNQQNEEIVNEAQQFGLEFAEELGIYQGYIQVFSGLKVHQELPHLKATEIVHEMESIIKSIDYSSMALLKEQRQTLRRKFQIFKAMTVIKTGHKGTHQRKMHEQGYDF